MENIKVIVVDDHPIFRTGICLVLSDIKNVEIIGQASDGLEFLALLNSHKPDIVFMDIRMPRMNGIEATTEAIKRFPNLKIIALSMNDDEEYVESMIKAGASGFLVKRTSPDELERAINVVLHDENYFSHELMKMFSRKVTHHTNELSDSINLSKREKEVLNWICNGLSNAEIGEKLFLSPRTVENHRASLIEKTNSRNTVALVLYSIKNKLVAV